MSLVPREQEVVAPFGIAIRSSLDELTILHDFGENKFQVEAPRPHPLLQTYYVQAGRVAGVVWIKGVTAAIENDSFGYKLREMTDRLAGQMAQKYGTGQKNDLLLPGSIWEDAQYWMNGIAAGERLYSYNWDAMKRSRLPGDLQAIYCGVMAYDTFSGAVAIEFSSPDMALVESEINSGMAEYF